METARVARRTRNQWVMGGVTILSLAGIIQHFGSKRRQIIRSQPFYTILFEALSSKTLHGMWISSLLAAYAGKRAFGWKPQRVFSVFAIVMYVMIYRFRVVETARVSYAQTYWNTALVQKAKLQSTPFYPVVWAYAAHAQTVLLYAVSHLENIWAPGLEYERETIPAFDEPNVLPIDWTTFSESHTAKHRISHSPSLAHLESPIIVCVLGLGDDKNIPYFQRFARAALDRGYRVALFSYWRYDFEESRDLDAVLRHVQKRYPAAPVSAVGWSAGVYKLLRYLEKAKTETPLVAAVCLSGCLDFVEACNSVYLNESPAMKGYGAFLAFQGRACVRRHMENDKRLTAEQKNEINLLMGREGDPMKLYNGFMQIIRPLGADEDKPWDRHALGHKGIVAADEPERASHYTHRAIDYLDDIKVTTLLIHAEDDPVVASEHVDWGKVENARQIIVAHTIRGGHCCHFQGWAPFGLTWDVAASLDYLGAVLEMHAQTHFFVEIMKNTGFVMGGVRDSFQSQPTTSVGSNFKSTVASNKLTPRAMARIVSSSDLAAIVGVSKSATTTPGSPNMGLKKN